MWVRILDSLILTVPLQLLILFALYGIYRRGFSSSVPSSLPGSKSSDFPAFESSKDAFLHTIDAYLEGDVSQAKVLHPDLYKILQKVKL